MIPIEINLDKGKTYYLPERWEEVTVKQWLELRFAERFSDVLSVLASIPIEKVRQATDLTLDTRISPYLKWIETQPDWENLKPPKKVMFKGKEIRIPSDLGYSTFEQVENLKITVSQELERQQDKESFTYHDIIVPAVSEYLQPLYDGTTYDTDRAKEYEEEVLQMPILEVYPIASFFLLNYLGWSELRKIDFNQPRLRLILKLRKRILNLLTNLEYLAQYTVSRQETFLSSQRRSKRNGIQS